MSKQTISYGSVTFPFTQVEVEQSPKFADDGIQHEGIQYDFTIRGVLAADTQANLNNLMLTMRNQLGKRGLIFSLKWTDDASVDTVFYRFDPTNDDDWGPRPSPVRFMRFGGGIVTSYEWHVTCVAKECYDYRGTPFTPTENDGILSIVTRWTHSVDVNGLTTRNLSGKLTISARSVAAGKSADAYRARVEPALPFEFRREQREYEVSADGRVLSFSITDVEKYCTLPDPITDGAANFTVKLANTGMTAYFSCGGYFEAPRGVDKSVLLNRISGLLTAKLGPYFTPANPVIFETQELTSAIYKNRIDFNFAGFFAIFGSQPSTTPTTFTYSALLSTLLQGDTQSNGRAHLTGPYGGDATAGSGVTADLPLFNNDACTPQLITPSNGYGTSVTTYGDEGTPPAVASVYPYGTGGSSADHRSNPWIAFHEELHWEIDNGIRTFEPKYKNSSPLFQQVHPATVTVIQGGYAVKVGVSVMDGSPPVPPPVLDAAHGVILSESIQPSSPEPIGDGSMNRYTTHWRYVIRARQQPSQSNVYQLDPAPAYPDDPRRSTYVSGTSAGPVQGEADTDSSIVVAT